MDPFDQSTEVEKTIFTGPVLMSLGAALTLVGLYFLWHALVAGNILRNEWTAEEKKQALIELTEKAKSQGVVEPSREEKLRILQGL
jgi:hypothetical protein